MTVGSTRSPLKTDQVEVLEQRLDLGQVGLHPLVLSGLSSQDLITDQTRVGVEEEISNGLLNGKEKGQKNTFVLCFVVRSTVWKPFGYFPRLYGRMDTYALFQIGRLDVHHAGAATGVTRVPASVGPGAGVHGTTHRGQ